MARTKNVDSGFTKIKEKTHKYGVNSKIFAPAAGYFPKLTSISPFLIKKRRPKGGEIFFGTKILVIAKTNKKTLRKARSQIYVKAIFGV